jgi:hypothetical protein
VEQGLALEKGHEMRLPPKRAGYVRIGTISDCDAELYGDLGLRALCETDESNKTRLLLEARGQWPTELFQRWSATNDPDDFPWRLATVALVPLLPGEPQGDDPFDRWESVEQVV